MKKKDTLLYIVAHNHEKYLNQSLESVFSQLDSETDVILIDSGSKDESNDILAEYAEKFNLRLYSKHMILTDIIDWVYKNFLDKYKFIIRLDADDSLRSGAIQILKKHIKTNKKIGSISGSWVEIDEKSNALNRMILDDGEAIEAFHGACTLFRTDALKDISFKSNGVNAQDGLYTWLCIKSKWSCKTIPDLIFQYRRHKDNLSNDEDKLFLNRKMAYKSVFKSKENTSKSCAIIGYLEEDLEQYEVKINSNFYPNLISQLDYLEKSETIEKVFISCESDILKKLELDGYKKVSFVKRTSEELSLLKSLQNCSNIKTVLENYTDVLIVNPVKHIWTDAIIDIAIYSKYIHEYNSVITCKLLKGAVYENNNNSLNIINFSGPNTAITSRFLYIRMPGFILLDINNFYNMKDDLPHPVGHVSDNFLTLGWDSI
tara:strand:- start:15018 stop:16310 length:1293 start_codon:yes stop_codon:yes gene_type:complete